MHGYAEADPGYGEVDPGYSEEEPVGYYAEEDRAYAEQPYDGWAEPNEYGRYDSAYAEVPEMVGWAESEPLADEYSGYGAPEFEGYVRDFTVAVQCRMPPPLERRRVRGGGSVRGIRETGDRQRGVRVLHGAARRDAVRP